MELDVRTRRLGSIANTLTLVYVLEKQIENQEKELTLQEDLIFEEKSSNFLKSPKKISLMKDGLSIINDKKKSSYYPYENIVELKLLNVNTVNISFKGEEKDFTFETKDAPKLLQSIRIRRHKLLTLQKKKLMLNLSYRFYSKLNDSSGNISLVNNWKPSLPQSMILSKAESRELARLIEEEENQDVVNVKRVNSLSEEDFSKLENAIHPLIFAHKKYEEAKAVKNFVDNFDTLGRDSEKVAQKTREFLDTLKERLLYVHKDLILNSLNKDVSIDILNSSIEKILQKTIISRIYKQLMNIFTKNMGHIDNIIESKKAFIRKLSQEDVGIPAKLVSKSKWSFAILELNNMNNYILPFERLECILSCVRAVVDTTRIEKSFSESSGISADDLLPILIYIVSSSAITGLESLIQFLWLVSDPAELSGESGYYLTMFTSVVEFIKNYEEPVFETKPKEGLQKSQSFQDDIPSVSSEKIPIKNEETKKKPFNTMRKRSGSYTSGGIAQPNRRDLRSMVIGTPESYDFFCVPLIFKEISKKE